MHNLYSNWTAQLPQLVVSENSLTLNLQKCTLILYQPPPTLIVKWHLEPFYMNYWPISYHVKSDSVQLTNSLTQQVSLMVLYTETDIIETKYNYFHFRINTKRKLEVCIQWGSEFCHKYQLAHKSPTNQMVKNRTQYHCTSVHIFSGIRKHQANWWWIGGILNHLLIHSIYRVDHCSRNTAPQNL